jgi:hypothetical protein
MASIVIEVPCGDEVHRIELRDDGTAKVLDHDPRVVAAFTRMGATPPECAEDVAIYEKDPVDYILKMEYGKRLGVGIPTSGRLACDYAEHVLPFFEMEFPDDPRPRVAIETAREYWEYWPSGTVSFALMDKVEKAEDDAFAAAREPWSLAAVKAANAAALAATSARSGPFHDSWGAARMAAAAGRAYHDSGSWVSGEEAKDAEQAWQLKHAFKAIKAVEEGKPWPAL